MEISQTLLALLLFKSFVFGGICGVFYDLNRIVRVLFGVKYSKKAYDKLYAVKLPIVRKKVSMGEKSGALQAIVINVGDFLCVIFAAVGIIILNYAYNSGRFRFFTVIGMGVGFIIYRYTVGKLVIAVAEPIAFIFKYFLLSIILIFSCPFVKAGSHIGKFVKKIIYLYSFTLEKKKKELYNIDEKVFATEEGETAMPSSSSQRRLKRSKRRRSGE